MTANLPLDPVQVLLIEDNAADIQQVQDTLREGKLLLGIRTIDGDTARTVFAGDGVAAGVSLPDLILFGLSLSNAQHEQFLLDMKEHPALEGIPLVLLAQSESLKRLGNCPVDACLPKPINLAGLMDLISSIDNFRFQIVIGSD